MGDGTRLIVISEPDDPRIAEFVSLRERDLVGRGDRFIAEGTVVLSALMDAETAGSSNGDFVIEKLLLLENRVEGLSSLLARLDPAVPVHVAPARVINAVVGFAMHRGVLALGRRLPMPDLAAFLAAMPANALLVAALGIANHDNMGGLFRNAAVFGADGLIFDPTSCDPLYRKAIRVSVGAVLRVPFCRAASQADLVSGLIAAGFDPVGLSPRGAMALSEYRPGQKVALLAGAEGEGLRADILARVATLRISQAPGLDSLNVATATGIALHALAHRMGRLSDRT